ncbi:unnamed protein product [Caenorhabditis angaria]|uniref:RING-type domain-containing protein n=1 Tax=Caenorhabditis angaria TaxID=860376 RepID=A0A9P1INX4_9PELO|nr:unnamed protein product [Caenorhabditis angaria]
MEKENEQLKNDLETKEKRIQQLYQQFKTEEATTSTWKFENEQKTKVLKEQLKHVSEDANRKENENIELKMRNNELEQNVKSLSEKLNENQKYIGFLESNMSYGIPPGLSLQQNHKPISNEDKMKEYEKIMKIDFGSSLDSMTRIVNKFKEIKSKGNSEIEIFKEKCLDYVKMVSDEYKNNNLTAEIPDIPQPFSLEFMQNYERLLKKGPSPVKWEKIEKKEKEKELEDNECLICFYDMEFHHRSTKCENCSRKFHKDCVSEWLKLNSICPVCRVSLPDPNEYPTL